jgi:hypothetical protein
VTYSAPLEEYLAQPGTPLFCLSAHRDAPILIISTLLDQLQMLQLQTTSAIIRMRMGMGANTIRSVRSTYLGMQDLERYSKTKIMTAYSPMLVVQLLALWLMGVTALRRIAIL